VLLENGTDASGATVSVPEFGFLTTCDEAGGFAIPGLPADGALSYLLVATLTEGDAKFAAFEPGVKVGATAVSDAGIIYLAPVDFVYDGGDDLSPYQLVANAAQQGAKVRLTSAGADQRGALWHKGQVDVVDGFASEFLFQVSSPGGLVNAQDGAPGADGMAFVLQNSTGVAIGTTGGTMAYDIPNSIALEFDTWTNLGFLDPNGNHVSIHTNGTLTNSPSEAVSIGAAPATVNLSGGEIQHCRLEYEPGQMRIYLNDMDQPLVTAPVLLSSLLDLPIGTAWVGFTAATASSWENHELLYWSFGPLH
jgi:hypothetical protein